MSRPVLAGVDGSERGMAAVDWAAAEAVLRGLPLRLVQASPSLPDEVVPDAAAEMLHRVGERVLQRAVADLGARCPDLQVRAEQTAEAPAAALLAAARDAALLVVGTRGAGGFDGLAVGSVALRAAAAAVCPVVLVPSRPVGGFEAGEGARSAAEVVVGFDSHRPVGELADFAFTSAEGREAALHVVKAWALPAEAVSPQRLFVTEEDRATWEDQEVFRAADGLRPWRDKYPGVTVRTDVVLLHPAQALLNACRRSDLLVVGRRTDPGAVEGRLGPVTHAVLHHTRCPVVVVPHAG
ncbi:universal stress protein [Streptomyces caniscabiei]|uniref:Universal stress protein n=1 Tax=Streptomyces caniscabiei TaxID=2746961 RepID=A0ABU4N1W5_9ACTN|nr:universal stress protein [Streptomyces caniscabiei]MBE4733503.1 universal stress protein [Streptomyces caniscabiei]MBE4754680.1 universal stress protein [Streptomyces caniscabiei]MBE4768499.1 universal stress protein [Streptomyces caniscabiei]MBE4781998.1 universal stress protein [Streptomyces caniscabiei]MBE4793287.1 universal stress protein [Streptomyces caniscabiei]